MANETMFWIQLILGLVLLVSGMVILLTLGSNYKTETIKVPCYDRFANVIQGLDCTQTNYSYNSYLYIGIITSSFGFFMFLSSEMFWRDYGL